MLQISLNRGNGYTARYKDKNYQIKPENLIPLLRIAADDNIPVQCLGFDMPLVPYIHV